MIQRPYPTYSLLSSSGLLCDNIGLLSYEQVSWCRQNLEPDDWDLDPLNAEIIFRDSEVLALFCLSWC